MTVVAADERVETHVIASWHQSRRERQAERARLQRQHERDIELWNLAQARPRAAPANLNPWVLRGLVVAKWLNLAGAIAALACFLGGSLSAVAVMCLCGALSLTFWLARLSLGDPAGA